MQKIWLVVFCAWLLVGCLERESEFEALNLGYVKTNYEPMNKALHIRTFDSKSTHSEESHIESQPFGIFFFTTICGVCEAQIPILQEISKDGFVIYGVVGNLSDRAKISEFVKAKHINMPVFYQREAVSYFSNLVGGILGVPILFLFDKNGVIKEKFLGLTPKSTLQKAIAMMS